MPPIQRGPVLSPPRFFMVVTAWRVNLLGEIIKNHTLMLNISKLLHFSFCLNSVFTNDGYFGSSTILFPFTVENCPKLRKKTSEKQKTSKHVSDLFLVFLCWLWSGISLLGKVVSIWQIILLTFFGLMLSMYSRSSNDLWLQFSLESSD